VITLDTLFGYRDHTDAWHEGMWDAGLREKVSSLTVLTFGSPITHIYQHYFSRLYPPFKDVEAFQRASNDDKVTWINCYRLDDYIGIWVDGTLPHFPDNVPMAVGGHVNYWLDDVFGRLFKHPRMQKVLIDTSVPASPSADPATAVPA
jgi:hypothetical protein